MGLSLISLGEPADQELLRGLMQQLVQRAKSADDAAQIPLRTLELLAAGEADTMDLEQILRCLEELKRKTEGTAELARLMSLLYDAQWSHGGLLMVVTIRGSSGWGQFLSSAQRGPQGLVATSDWIQGDHERWELHRLDHSPNTFALKNVVTGGWLSADHHTELIKLRAERSDWESWQMFSRNNNGVGCIALRSHHGSFLCQEQPGNPTWMPWEWGGGIHRMFTGQLNVVANRKDVWEWETFTLCDAQGQPLHGARWKQLEVTLPAVE